MQVYLDNNTTTMLDPQVKAAMEPFFTQNYGTPHALHHYASALYQPLRDAYERIYATLNASHEDSIIATSGASESNNWVMMSTYFDSILTTQKSHILVSEAQNPSIIQTAKFLQSKGVKVTFLPLNAEGIVEAHTVRDFITPKTALVSIPWANAKSGAIFPIEEIAYLCQAKGVRFHSDATQAIGKISISLKDTPIDYLSFSAHTFHGPKGVGGLYMRSGKELSPMLHGDEAMGGYRAGMPNVPAIVGMGKAMELAFDAMDFEMEDTRELRDELEEALLSIPHTFVAIPQEKRLANSVAITFEGVHNEALLWDLSQAGVAATQGDQNDSVSFALSRFSTQEEMNYTIEAVKKALERLRAIAGSYKK
ncbi:MAG: aminotransferase class V-fold PLP-dependent enzyme [Campylobacterales bacterium]|nr:aminotransferase class V-fold PLP-dependent enzyme [Campylobacterales bacterium]